MIQDIKQLLPDDLKGIVKSWNMPSFHAMQIFSWLYQKRAENFDQMSNLPFELRAKLREKFYLFGLRLLKVFKSSDGTRKLLLALKDKNFIEAVIIPAEKRLTACISSQVGCRFACCFCASGLRGFKRNLNCGEMIEELLYLKKNSGNRRLTHIVFMGIGEPLDNYDNVLKAIKIINSPDAFNIASRRITISTSGVIPGIERLSNEGLQVELSISLHAGDEKTRSLIMPINRIYPLNALLSVCREYIRKTNRQITFEYVLVRGLNSSLQNAQRLGIILKDMNCKVNLIPANPIKELKIAPPEKEGILSFKHSLLKSGVHVTLRKPRGKDIQAACGQLLSKVKI